MKRGTTPTHCFKLSIDTSVIQEVRITYRQQHKNLIEKSEKDVEMAGDTIRLSLTQEETLLFKPGVNVRLQIKVRTASNAVLASQIENLTVDDILCEEVLG